MQSQTVIEKYENLDENLRDDFLNEHLQELVCDGCGLSITGAFRIIPKNLNVNERTIILHLFPSKDESCKLRFCSGCGTHCNTLERICEYEIFHEKCNTILSIDDINCPKCGTFDNITTKSNCPKCNKQNNEHVRIKL